jgi:hypothetical protein
VTGDRPDRAVQQRARASGDSTVNQVAGDQYIYVGVPLASGPRVLLSPEDFWQGQAPPLPGQDQPLVGRDEHVTTLRSALDVRGAPDTPRIVVVEGAPGIGKTRLAVDVSSQVAPTLVARAGVVVTINDLTVVATDTPTILVIDDARSGSALAGLAALIGDPRYKQVKIVFTLQPGIARQVLAEAGLGQVKPVVVTLDRLTDAEIDQIIVNHQITNDEFRLHVASIAAGNPLLAHTACELAHRKGTYHWRDSSELLRELFEDRLAQIPGMTFAHRAVAIALAMMTRASSGENLAVLAGAITALPSEPDRLDNLLGDLVQAGIADEWPYALRPDAIGPVVVASGMTGTGVKIKIDRVLGALGGIGPGTTADSTTGNVNTTVFATQISILAQAAYQADNNGILGVLHRAVGDMVEAETSIDGWLDALVLAGQVAPFSPRLVSELRDLLISQWPLAPGASWWNEDPEQRYRFDAERLLRQAVTIAEQVGHVDAERAVRWILDVVWLAYPVLSHPSVEFAQRAVSSLVKVRLRAVEGWDDVFARRDDVLRAVLRWGRERRASTPVGLVPNEHEVRHSVVAEEVFFAALGPFLTVVTEDHVRGVPGDADVVLWGHHVLPDDLRTTTMLVAASTAVGELIGRLDPRDPQSRCVLNQIARLPFRLRGEGARGLSSTAPLPDYAVAALTKAGDAISTALAGRWAELPIMVRHAAAEHAVRPAGRPAASLSDLSGAGDPIAAVAVADRALGQLLILLPLDEHLSLYRLGDEEARRVEEQRRRHASEELGTQLSTEDTIALLETIDSASASAFGHDCLGWFATAAGRSTTDVDTVLNRLAEGPLPAGTALLKGLLQSHPEPVTVWLTSNVTNPQIAGLAAGVAPEFPAEGEADILDSVIEFVCGQPHGNDGTGRPTPDDNTVSADDELSSTEAGLGSLAYQLAWSVARSRQPNGWRLARLATLGTDGPAAALPAILAAAGTILRTTAVGDRPTQGSSALREKLVAVLSRTLAESDRDPYASVNYDIATGVVSLAGAAPEEVAELLMQRIMDEVERVLPSECKELLYSTDVEQRETVALAFQGLLDKHREAGTLTERMETVALRVASQLGSGSDGWLQIIRRLAGGTADDRARAAKLVKNSWHHSAWAEIVANLIDAGLDEASFQLGVGDDARFW